MRLVTFLAAGERRAGALLDQRVLDLNRADPMLPTDVLHLLQGGRPMLERARRAVAAADPAVAEPLDRVELLAPIPRPPKILCIGLNYADHVAEAAAVTSPPMDKPSVFVKVASAVIGSGQPIMRPSTTKQLDYEVELAVVVGERAKAVTRERALGCIAGYTIFNDVSARDLQFARDGGITVGKNFDMF